MDKNDLPEEVLAGLDVDLENLDEMLDDMEETREEETFKNWGFWAVKKLGNFSPKLMNFAVNWVTLFDMVEVMVWLQYSCSLFLKNLYQVFKQDMASSLQGKVCLVTGASRGIGRGIALQLGEAGATVYITGKRNDLTVWEKKIPRHSIEA